MRAGIPATVILFSINDLLTTEFAPMVTLLPITIFPNSFAPGEIKQLSPMVGVSSFDLFCPIFTSTCIDAYFPILANRLITIVPL